MIGIIYAFYTTQRYWGTFKNISLCLKIEISKQFVKTHQIIKLYYSHYINVKIWAKLSYFTVLGALNWSWTFWQKTYKLLHDHWSRDHCSIIGIIWLFPNNFFFWYCIRRTSSPANPQKLAKFNSSSILWLIFPTNPVLFHVLKIEILFSTSRTLKFRQKISFYLKLMISVANNSQGVWNRCPVNDRGHGSNIW